MEHLIIGLAGKAGSGKDTLYNIIEQAIYAHVQTERWSVGDILREQLNELSTLSDLGVDLFSLKGAQKEKWRPFMAAYGNACRQETKGRYFIELLDEKMQEKRVYPRLVRFITDIRFDQFEHDEVSWIKDECKGKLVYIDRYTTDLEGNKSSIPFVNDLERSQDENLRKKADLIIEWPTVNDRKILLEYAEPLITRIKQDWLPL